MSPSRLFYLNAGRPLIYERSIDRSDSLFCLDLIYRRRIESAEVFFSNLIQSVHLLIGELQAKASVLGYFVRSDTRRMLEDLRSDD